MLFATAETVLGDEAGLTEADGLSEEAGLAEVGLAEVDGFDVATGLTEEAGLTEVDGLTEEIFVVGSAVFISFTGCATLALVVLFEFDTGTNKGLMAR